MARALFDQFNVDARGIRVTFSHKGRRHVPDEYMKKLGTRFANRDAWVKISDQLPNNQLWLGPRQGEEWNWKNSQTWHDFARKNDGSYNRTGGMWSGLQVRNYGTFGAVIEFAGQSVGQSWTKKAKRGRVKEGQERGTTWSSKVPNRFKAWTVFEEHNVLVVAPDRATQLALEDAIEEIASNWSQVIVGGGAIQYKDTSRGGMGSLTREFIAAMQGR